MRPDAPASSASPRSAAPRAAQRTGPSQASPAPEQPPAAGLADAAFHTAILESLGHGVYFVDRERTITYWNPAAERLSGRGPEEMLGRHCYDNILGHTDASGRPLCFGGCPLQATMGDGREREAELWLRHADGERRPVRVHAAPLRNEADEIVGAVEVFYDGAPFLAAREQAEAAGRAALTDDLTGLPNRRAFDAALAGRLGDLARHGTPVALLIADLDRFKETNDRLGHAAGDACLRDVSAVLGGGIRDGDFVARWGGEEFAIIAGHAAADDALALAERLRGLVTASVPGTTMSVGVAVARLGEDAGRLVARADAAMYAAKAAGRNRVVLEAEPA